MNETANPQTDNGKVKRELPVQLGLFGLYLAVPQVLCGSYALVASLFSTGLGAFLSGLVPYFLSPAVLALICFALSRYGRSRACFFAGALLALSAIAQFVAGFFCGSVYGLVFGLLAALVNLLAAALSLANASRADVPATVAPASPAGRKSNLPWFMGILGFFLTLLHLAWALKFVFVTASFFEDLSHTLADVARSSSVIAIVLLALCLPLTFLGRSAWSRLSGVLTVLLAAVAAVFGLASFSVCGLLASLSYICAGLVSYRNHLRN